MAKTVFIGGGNMATALLGGLLKSGADAADIVVVEPDAGQRQRLENGHRGIVAVAAAGDAIEALASAELVVWAVKPQVFASAAAAAAPHAASALQLSVMAGVRSERIAAASGSERVVRAMPNTPALIGEGIAGLFARPAASADDRARCEALLAPTGQTLWVEKEEALDAVTALSGSGPAYVFYLLEAMLEAGAALGLPPEQASRLALQTVRGSAALAAGSAESPSELRRRVTSPGGTTQAAIAALDEHGVRAAFVAAIVAAGRRARELGDALER